MRDLGNDVRGLPPGSYLLVSGLAAGRAQLRNGESIDTSSVKVSVMLPYGRRFAEFELAVGRGLPMVAQIVGVESTYPNPAEILHLLEHGVAEPRKGH
jgi:hypothetical protein